MAAEQESADETPQLAIEQFDPTADWPSDERYRALRATFPEAFSENAIDFDALRRALADWEEPGPERFGLTWPGKAECVRVVQQPALGALRPQPDESVEWDDTRNVVIEGENLETLKLLQKAYYGRVKMVYIDPPYNTGKEFIYPDNYAEGLDGYLRYSGQIDDQGMRLSANTETSGRYHSRWLSMMYPRLFLARSLLQQEGFIFVSIGDHEVHHLRMLMNEVFGEENFVACMVWQGGRRNDSKLVSTGHDYILVYARNLALVTEQDLHWEEKKQGLEPIYEAAESIRERCEGDFDEAHQLLLEWYRELPEGHPSLDHDHYSYLDERGVYYKDNISSPNPRPNLTYEFEGYQPPANGWRYEPETMQRLHDDGRLVLPAKKSQRIAVKRYLHETATWAPSSVFYKDRRGARKVVEDLLDVSAKGLFDFPKDHGVLGRLIATVTAGDDLVVDFFAGSGSTAHAVMEQNAVDGEHRRFMLVQLPEPVDNDTYPTISDITRARVKAAGEALRSDADVDLGFRSYVLAPSALARWSSTASSAEDLGAQLTLHAAGLVDGANPSDLVAELLLKAGFELTAPVEVLEVAGHEVFSVEGGELLVYAGEQLTLEVVEQLVEREPALILVLDSSFGDDDQLKVNAMQTVRSHNQGAGIDIAIKVV